MPAAAVRRVGRVVVLVHLPVDVSTDEWNGHVEQMFTHLCAPEVDTIVVWTDGQLNALQRQSVADMHGRLRREGRAAPAAFTFTDSTLSRGVMTALRWIGVLQARAFPKAALTSTLNAAGYAPATTNDVLQTVRDLERELRG